MKLTKQKVLSILTVASLTLSGMSQASLHNRGEGLIYDDVLDVTWLQDANYAKTSGHDTDGIMNWFAANSWAGGLSYDGGIYGTINDWRLADVKPVNNTSFDYGFADDGSKDRGYNINSTQSEMAYMFYQNLGNTGYYDTSGSRTGCFGTGLCVTNKGLFENLDSSLYWSAVEYAPNTNFGWAFSTHDGSQFEDDKINEFSAWAVRSGDVTVVPVPAAI